MAERPVFGPVVVLRAWSEGPGQVRVRVLDGGGGQQMASLVVTSEAELYDVLGQWLRHVTD